MEKTSVPMHGMARFSGAEGLRVWILIVLSFYPSFPASLRSFPLDFRICPSPVG